MKMSPRWGVAVVQASLSVVERDFAVERLVELHFGSGETEAVILGRDLEASAVPLHDIVVADDALVTEGANALQILGSQAPGGGRLTWAAGEAAIVISDETTKDLVGRVQIAGAGQTKFTAQAVLQDAPEALHAAFGLGRARGDEGDAEIGQGPTELGGFALTGEFFLEGPILIVANEDAAAIAVEGGGDAEAAQKALQQVEVAFGGFRQEKLSRQDFSGSVVLHAQSVEARGAAFQPVMR